MYVKSLDFALYQLCMCVCRLHLSAHICSTVADFSAFYVGQWQGVDLGSFLFCDASYSTVWNRFHTARLTQLFFVQSTTV